MAGKSNVDVTVNMKRVGTDLLNRVEPPSTPGEALRYWRQYRKVSQHDLALRLGYKRYLNSRIARLERGKQPIGMQMARRIGDVLDVHPALILFPDLLKGRL